jgi:molybdate transport system permease protein
MQDPFWQEVFLTVRLASTTTLLLLVIGLPMAHWLNQRRGSWAPVLEALVGLPLVLPPTVLGFYLLVLFSPNHWLGSLWQGCFGHALPFSFEGLVAGSVLYSLPFAVQPFQAGLRSIPGEVLDAAALDARPMQVFLHVRLPVAARGILTGAALSFAHTIGEFGVVLMLGGNIPGQTRVASVALYDAVQNMDYGSAHRFALVLFGFALVVLTSVARIQRRAGLLS